MKKIGLILVAFLMVFSIFGTSMASAESYEGNNLEKTLEMKMKYYYEDIGELTSDGYVIHDQEAFDKRVEEGDVFALELQSIMEKEKIKELQSLRSGEVSTFGAGSFVSCIGNRFAEDFTNDVKLILNGNLYYYIATKQFDIAAKELAGFLKRQGFRANAVTMAAQLTYYGFLCRNAW